MEDILRELIKSQLHEDKMMPHDEEAMNRIVDEAYCMAENRDLATTLDTIVGTALKTHEEALMSVEELKASDCMDLTKLSVQDYVTDYELYLKHCTDPAQRNLYTYFKEFEHQEGEIKAWKKGVVANTVTRKLLEPLRKAMSGIELQVQGWVLKCVSNNTEEFDEPGLYSHEAMEEFVESYIRAIERGIDKM